MSFKHFAALLLLLSASVVLGDEAPPRPRPAREAPAAAAKEATQGLVVEFDASAPTPRLQIPKKLLAAQANPAPDSRDGARGDARPSYLPTIMAGLALTLGLVCGGLWLVRAGCMRRRSRACWSVRSFWAVRSCGPMSPPPGFARHRFRHRRSRACSSTRSRSRSWSRATS